jgi:hypothetical protein
MHEIKSVQAIVSNPSPSDPAGRVTVGYYVLRNGLLTMTDSKGAPVRSHGGDKYEQKTGEGDNVPLIAQRLTMKIYRARNGNDMAGFNRPLSYPAAGTPW